MKIGYYRIVNPEINNTPQTEEILKAGAEKIIYDLDNTEDFYPNREALLKQLKEEDIVIIYQLDHLFHSIKNFNFLTKNFQKNSISLISLNEKVNTIKDPYFYNLV